MKSAMGGAHALLTVGFEPGTSAAALKVLKDKLSDGWSESFGAGHTTADGKRPDVVVKSGEWSGTLKGQVVGSAEGGTHKAVAMKQDAKSLGAPCKGCQKIQNPVMDVDFADPVVVRDGSTYFGFATGSSVVRRTSTNLQQWSPREDTITTVPGWQENSGNKGLWAPAVYRAGNGKWVMYYAAQVDGPSEQRCIGKARSDSPGGVFQPDGKFICDNRWSIDPSVFSHGKKDYLLWRQDTAAQPSGTIYIQRLDGKGDLTQGAKQLLARSDAASSWEFDAKGGVMENPAMVLRDNVYHLFYSANRWETAKYGNGHAVCQTAMGPCKRTSVKKAWRGSKGAMKGPGGADVVKTPDGTTLMYMHGWDGAHVGPDDKEAHRKLWIFRLKINGKKAKLKPY
ncbi:MAG: hypothetical protein EOO75_11325 [Myxococcales bacterium]|nr:MAG: hypothetical protein EOO75_11325 [Myxococcales bacterium]